MAKAEIKYQPTQPVDAWDLVKKVTLELTREEAKVIQALTGHVITGKSGAAGAAVNRIYDVLHAAVSRWDNNLFIDGPTIIISSK